MEKMMGIQERGRESRDRCKFEERRKKRRRCGGIRQ